jgi:hypothetical protein
VLSRSLSQQHGASSGYGCKRRLEDVNGSKQSQPVWAVRRKMIRKCYRKPRIWAYSLGERRQLKNDICVFVGSCNVRSHKRETSLKRGVRKLRKYRLAFLRVEIRRDKTVNETMHNSYVKGEKYQSGTDFFCRVPE